MLGVWATPTSDRTTTVPQSVPFPEKPVGIRNELYTQDHTYNTRLNHHSTTVSTIFRETRGYKERTVYTQDHTHTRLDHHRSAVSTIFRETRGHKERTVYTQDHTYNTRLDHHRSTETRGQPALRVGRCSGQRRWQAS